MARSMFAFMTRGSLRHQTKIQQWLAARPTIQNTNGCLEQRGKHATALPVCQVGGAASATFGQGFFTFYAGTSCFA